MRIIKILLVFLILGAVQSGAQETYLFNCKDSLVEGFIKYGVIGTYDFSFKDCAGSFVYDPVKEQIKSVEFKIKTKSLKSNCNWCDEIVLSKRLLNANAYPYLGYQSQKFLKQSSGAQVEGDISICGVTRKFKSEFSMKPEKKDIFLLEGKWLIRRKDFKISWNKLLDKGGVLVGDIITVHWKVHARRQ